MAANPDTCEYTAINCWLNPLPDVGEREITLGAWFAMLNVLKVTGTLANLLPSATLVAVMVTTCGVEIVTGPQ